MTNKPLGSFSKKTTPISTEMILDVALVCLSAAAAFLPIKSRAVQIAVGTAVAVVKIIRDSCHK